MALNRMSCLPPMLKVWSFLVYQICLLSYKFLTLEHHIMSHDDKSFVYLNYATSLSVMTVDDTLMPLTSVGCVSTSTLSFYDVNYISNLTLSLVPMSQLCNFSYSFMFSSTYCMYDSHLGRLIETWRKQGNFMFWMS